MLVTLHCDYQAAPILAYILGETAARIASLASGTEKIIVEHTAETGVQTTQQG